MGQFPGRVAMSQRRNFDGGKELTAIRNENPVLGNWMRRVGAALNRLGVNTGTSPVGRSAPPPPVGGLNIKANGEMVHATINDASAATTSREYWIESATNPNFLYPHTEHLMASRGKFFNLPSKTDSGTPHSWYFRAYSQEPGSEPSAPVYFGGLSPTPVTLSGSTQLTPLQSTGSGTASDTGGQGGWGRGKTPIRLAGGN